jgi:Fuc2NAc and GlcNAc transferase
MFICFAILLFLLSVTLVKLFQGIALKKSWLDIPTARSSHKTATVRGGGAIFMGLWLGVVALAWQQGWISDGTWRLLCLVPLVIGIMGFWDDLRSLSPARRLMIQVGVALWVVAEIATQGLIPLWPEWLLGEIGAGIFLGVTLIWFINLFNFMDGLDGFAGSEAVVVLGFGSYFLWASGALVLAYLAFLLACSVLGFLVWNWPKASIFMGDVGSMTLGVVLVLFAYLGQGMSAQSLSIWCILSALFWFDATLTLLRRFIQGSSWMKPHKQHAYQRLHQIGWKVSHIVVSSLFLNVVLGIIALCVYYHRLSAGMGIGLVITGLSLIYLWIEQQKPMLMEKEIEPVMESIGRT